jgi:hypothetical protein
MEPSVQMQPNAAHIDIPEVTIKAQEKDHHAPLLLTIALRNLINGTARNIALIAVIPAICGQTIEKFAPR